jgi:hypothetical protein
MSLVGRDGGGKTRGQEERHLGSPEKLVTVLPLRLPSQSFTWEPQALKG